MKEFCLSPIYELCYSGIFNICQYLYIGVGIPSFVGGGFRL